MPGPGGYDIDNSGFWLNRLFDRKRCEEVDEHKRQERTKEQSREKFPTNAGCTSR